MTDEELEEVYKLAEKLDDHSSKLYNKLDYDRCRELERAVKDGNEVIIVPTGTMDRLTKEDKIITKCDKCGSENIEVKRVRNEQENCVEYIFSCNDCGHKTKFKRYIWTQDFI